METCSIRLSSYLPDIILPDIIPPYIILPFPDCVINYECHNMTTRILLILIPVTIVGCSQKSEITILDFDAQEVTDQVMAQYDGNDDGQLDKDEIQSSPGLASAVSDIDKDNNGSLSSDEIHTLLKLYVDTEVPLVNYPCLVTQKYEPLAGATVTLVPEDFLSSFVEPATGVTDERGMTYPSIELESTDRDSWSGFRLAIYKVEISKKDADGGELIPPEYNTQTQLGAYVREASITGGMHVDNTIRLELE